MRSLRAGPTEAVLDLRAHEGEVPASVGKYRLGADFVGRHGEVEARVEDGVQRKTADGLVGL